MALFQCNFFAETLGYCTSVQVLLPYGNHSWDSNRDFHKLYPRHQHFRTLYLLHGMYEDETTWIRRSNIERYAAARQIAVVFPAAQNSYYTDMCCGQDYFTYLTEELPAFVQATFPLSGQREDTFIAGLSMGGYGACKAALKKPELYAAFASLSGALDIGAVADYISNEFEYKTFTGVFGPPQKARGGPDDLFHLISKVDPAALPRAYFACGTEDELCYSMNQRFLKCMNQYQIEYTYEEGPGTHNWTFWDLYIQRALDWMLS